MGVEGGWMVNDLWRVDPLIGEETRGQGGERLAEEKKRRRKKKEKRGTLTDAKEEVLV